MIYCPKCDGETLVYDSRPCDEGVKRLRTCKECGFRFRTTERVNGSLHKAAIGIVKIAAKAGMPTEEAADTIMALGHAGTAAGQAFADMQKEGGALDERG